MDWELVPPKEGLLVPENQMLCLWNRRKCEPVTTHEVLEEELKKIGFVALKRNAPMVEMPYTRFDGWVWTTTTTSWETYFCVTNEGGLRRREARLPYPIISGAHPLVYLQFLNSISPSVRRADDIFSVKCVRVTDDVRAGTGIVQSDAGWDGMFYTSWLKELNVVSYRANTLDDVIRARGSIVFEYETDISKSWDDHFEDFNKWCSIKDDMERNFTGMQKNWQYAKYVELYNKESGRFIHDYDGLDKTMLGLGFIKYTDEDMAFHDEEEGIRELEGKYTFYCYQGQAANEESNQVWLPFPHFEASHPLTYLEFIAQICVVIGRDKVLETLDLKGTKLNMSTVLNAGGYDAMKDTRWKSSTGFKYVYKSLAGVGEPDDNLKELAADFCIEELDFELYKIQRALYREEEEKRELEELSFEIAQRDALLWAEVAD